MQKLYFVRLYSPIIGDQELHFYEEMKSSSSSRNDATEKMLRRREWKLEQERLRQHERLKQKKIYEYDMQRARQKGLLPPKPPNRSKSRSKSPRSRPRRPCTSSATNIPILSERLESKDGTVPLFKGPEGTKISAAELRRIKVDIHRNIPGKSTDSDLQRDIINPEDVIVKRRTEMKSNSSSRNDATEKMLRRREWKLEQERQRQHERLKQKKIYDYEMQRAREKGLLPLKPPNYSKSRSKSPRSRPRRPCTSSATNTPILSERLESKDGTVPLFKGPEGTKISATELRRIKVDIRQNIPGKSTDPDLQRDIINPEDVIVKRRTEMKSNSSSRNDATEKMLRRREWKLEQERQRQHERLKQKKIYDYEMQRAREKGLLPLKPPNYSKSRSKSPRSRPRRPCTSSATNTPILSERLESKDGTVPLFKGPEGTKISATELRRIKVDIRQNIPGKSTDPDLQRDIINPEDVIVKRRTGEGSKPIFEREEIKGVVPKTEEVEEHRTVVTVNNDTLEGKSKTFKKRSMSLSPIRNRSHSPRRTLSRHSRHEDSNHEDRRSYRDDRERYRSRNRSREYKNSYREKERRRTESQIVEEERDRRSRRDHSRSREREERKWDRDSHHRDERSHRDRRDREQRVPPPHYIGQIPVPIYYSHFPPRPMMMAPFMPHGRHPPMMGPMRPFPPRFSPSNPRFGPMF